MSTFTGFPERALIFFEGLEADNSKPYWTDNRDVYEEHVRGPMLALLAELEQEFGTGKMFRPYRDVRFAKDKTPYKTNAAATVSPFYVSLSADGLTLGGGIWRPAPDQLDRMRRAVADDVQGARLEQLVTALGAGAVVAHPHGVHPDPGLVAGDPAAGRVGAGQRRGERPAAAVSPLSYGRMRCTSPNSCQR